MILVHNAQWLLALVPVRLRWDLHSALHCKPWSRTASRVLLHSVVVREQRPSSTEASNWIPVGCTASYFGAVPTYRYLKSVQRVGKKMTTPFHHSQPFVNSSICGLILQNPTELGKLCVYYMSVNKMLGRYLLGWLSPYTPSPLNSVQYVDQE